MQTTTMLGIGEMKVSTDPEEHLVAPNLGSCLGVAVYDPVLKIGGMVHCLLPMSSSDPEKAKKNPGTYVDTGVSELLAKLIALGVPKSRLVIVVAGGSAINDPNNVFEIGKKNFAVLRKLLWKNNLLIKAEDIGGGQSRTVTLKIDTGEVWLKNPQGIRRLH